MKISIITVCYNSSTTIEKTIQSVAKQIYDNIEYIIVDGASTDNTLAIINNYSDVVSKVISEPDNGLYDAMNKGIQLCTGDVIGILNSDDLYQDPNVLSGVMNYFNSDPDLDILFGDIVFVKSNNINKVVRYWKPKPYSKNYFENGNVPPHPALFIRKRVYDKAGLYDLQYSLAADYEFMFRIFKKYKFSSKYISRLIVRMRLGGASNVNLKSTINANSEVLKTWKNHGYNIPFQLISLRILKRLIQFIK